MTETPISRLTGANYTSWALTPGSWLSPYSTRILTIEDAIAELDRVERGEEVPKPREVEPA